MATGRHLPAVDTLVPPGSVRDSREPAPWHAIPRSTVVVSSIAEARVRLRFARMLREARISVFTVHLLSDVEVGLAARVLWIRVPCSPRVTDWSPTKDLLTFSYLRVREVPVGRRFAVDTT